MNPHSSMPYVYVIGTEDGPYKIGFAVDLRTRFSSIQTGSPYRLVCHFAAQDECAPKYERELHERFARKRLVGEWFDTALQDIRAAFVELGLSVVDLPIGTPRPAAKEMPEDEVAELFRGKCTPERFTLFRESMGMNRSQVAEALGLSRNMPAKYEAGTATVPLYVALACAALVRGIAPWPG